MTAPEMTWHEAMLIAIQMNPELWPNYCPRCGVEDERPSVEHEAEFHSDREDAP